MAATATVGATPVNDAPTVTVPDAQAAGEDADLALSGISVGDVDNSSLTVNLQVSSGQLTLGTLAGLSVTGNGSGNGSLSGSVADLNAALASLVYRGNLNFSDADALQIMVNDGSPSLPIQNSVGITVLSAEQQVVLLQDQVDVLEAAGVLTHAQALAAKLQLKDNNGDAGKVQAFLNRIKAYLNAGILTQAQAEALLGPGNILLLSVARR